MSVAGSLIQASLEENTKTVYRRAWTQLKTFMIDQSLSLTLPVAERAIIMFIAHLFENNYAAATILTSISSISYVHQLHDFPDPSKSFLVRKLLQGVKKSNKSIDTRLPITLPMLQKLVMVAPLAFRSHFQCKCFIAMCVLAFHALLRVGEITQSKHNLQFDDIKLTQERVVVNFKSFKHDKGFGVSQVIQATPGLPTCPVFNLSHYFQCRGCKPGPLFLKVDNTPFSRAQFLEDMKLAFSFCGIPPGRYNTHSFRIGGLLI